MHGAKVTPPIPKHVFEDQSGKRLWYISALLIFGALAIIGFAVEFSIRVYNLKPPQLTHNIYEYSSDQNDTVLSGSDSITVIMKESAYTDCGQGLFNINPSKTGIAGFLPYNDPTALTGLRAHCRELDTLYYQAFSFGALDGAILPLGPSAAAFPLPEFVTGFSSRNRPVAFPVMTPINGTSAEGLAKIFSDPTSMERFLNQLKAQDIADVDGGICIDISAYPNMPSSHLMPLFNALNAWLTPLELRSCLIGDIDAGFWRDQALVNLVGKTVLRGFQQPSSPSAPVAPPSWFETSAIAAQKMASPERLSIALGSFSTLWKSGQRTAEQIPFSEAMLRASFFEGSVNFSANAGNSNIRYLDESRRLNQIWVLDAVSFYNQRAALNPDTEITIWPLGYEDSAIWDIVSLEPSSASAINAIEAEIDLSDHVTVKGSGPFSTHIAHATVGRRSVIPSAQNGQIIAQAYEQIPSPRRIRLFGDSASLELSIAFNGLGNEAQTERLLTLLAQHDISATFFLSVSDLLLSEKQVQNLIAAGHSIGTNTEPRESQLGVLQFFSTVANNLAQQLLQDKLGHHAIFVQNPSRYGQFPGDVAVLDQLQDLQAAGYLPVYSNFSAPYGLFEPAEFVSQVRQTALNASSNVLSFDFSEQNDQATNLALPEILQMLADDGFTFTTLPKIAGLQPNQVFPASDREPMVRDKAIYWLMTTTWIGVQNFVFLLALIVALRSPVYLVLAFARREKYAFDSSFTPPVTVVIPAYNEARVINKTLKSVLASDYPNLEVIVVDDGSKDGTAEVVSQLVQKDDRVSLIQQSNHGKWFAEDRALGFVDTEIFIIVDADTLLHKDAIKHLVQPFCDANVGAVAGTVEVGNRDNVITACQVIEYKISQNVMRRAYEVFNGILVVPGAIGAWRKDAVIESGMVSGDTITEDADLTVALHRSGHKVIYAPLAKSYTEAPNSVKSFMQQRLRWSLGMLQVSWKHRGSIIEGRPVGFISIVDAVWYRVVSSFVFPLVDFIILFTISSWVYTISTQGTLGLNDLSISVILLFLMLTFLDIINLAAAFWFERKVEWKLLFLVPFLRFGYRQLLYVSSMRSIFHAVTGRLRGWQKLKRTDTAQIFDEK